MADNIPNNIPVEVLEILSSDEDDDGKIKFKVSQTIPIKEVVNKVANTTTSSSARTPKQKTQKRKRVVTPQGTRNHALIPVADRVDVGCIYSTISGINWKQGNRNNRMSTEDSFMIMNIGKKFDKDGNKKWCLNMDAFFPYEFGGIADCPDMTAFLERCGVTNFESAFKSVNETFAQCHEPEFFPKGEGVLPKFVFVGGRRSDIIAKLLAILTFHASIKKDIETKIPNLELGDEDFVLVELPTEECSTVTIYFHYDKKFCRRHNGQLGQTATALNEVCNP